MAKRKPRKPYRGILSAPAPKYDGNTERWKKEIVVPKLFALLDHYGIDQNDTEKWYLLATNLAIDHVPGLVPPLKKGRKLAKRSALRDYQLFWAVSKAKLLNKSVKNTVRQLTNTDPRFKGKNPGTLRDRYYLLKDGRSIEARRLHEFMDWLESEDRMERQMQQDAEERREEHRREEEHALRRPEEDDWEYTK